VTGASLLQQHTHAVAEPVLRTPLQASQTSWLWWTGPPTPTMSELSPPPYVRSGLLCQPLHSSLFMNQQPARSNGSVVAPCANAVLCKMILTCFTPPGLQEHQRLAEPL
jgi:hypothetical protein